MEELDAQHSHRQDLFISPNISGSWFRASAMTTMNKNQPDAQ
jgi:hypothetical protein